MKLITFVMVFQRWVPVSPQQRHGSSIVEVYRIVEEVRKSYSVRLHSYFSLFSGISLFKLPQHKFIVFCNEITVIWKKSCNN